MHYKKQSKKRPPLYVRLVDHELDSWVRQYAARTRRTIEGTVELALAAFREHVIQNESNERKTANG
jgi:hypothetical protein